MSKIKLTGNASGTGVLTVTAPHPNPDRTLSLPDTTDTLAVNSDVTNKLPLAGGTMSGNLIVNASVNAAGSGTGGGFHFADGNAMIYRDTNDMVFKLQGAEKIRLPSSGGISFNGDSAASNALDDYEEGTFTTTANAGSGTITLVSSQDLGAYVKIGSLVHWSLHIGVSSTSSASGDLYFTLPFTLGNFGETAGEGSFACWVWAATTGDSGTWVGWVERGSNRAYLRRGIGTQPGTSANLMTGGTEIRMSGTFRTA